MTTTSEPRDVPAGEKFRFAGVEMRVWDGALTNGQYTLNIVTLFKGWESPWHVHHREDEGLYLVAGAISAKLGDAGFTEVRAGEFAFLPRGVPHGLRVIEEGTQILGVFTPPGFERFFREQALDFAEEEFTVRRGIEGANATDPFKRYDVEILGPLPTEPQRARRAPLVGQSKERRRTMSPPTVRDVAAGEQFLFLGAEMRAWGSDLTAGQYMLNIATFFEGWESPLHIHHREDEGLYVAVGVISAKRGDEPFREVRAGEFVFLPRGIPHGFRVIEAGTQVAGIVNPPGLETFFREQSLDFAGEDFNVDMAIAAAGEADPADRYGLEVLGPLPREESFD